MPTALLISGALGMLGWLCAWLAQRSVVTKGVELAAAVAGEQAAKGIALAAEAKVNTAVVELAAAKQRADSLQLQLDAERKARQDLVHGLAQKGVPVGDAVVDSALDRLYPDGDQGGSGAGPDASRDPQRMSGKPADPSGSSGRS